MKSVKKFLLSAVFSSCVAISPINASLFANGVGTNLNCIYSSIRSACAMTFGVVLYKLAPLLSYASHANIINNRFTREQLESGCKCFGGSLVLAGATDAILTSIAYNEKKNVDQENKILKEQNDRNMENIGRGLSAGYHIYG